VARRHEGLKIGVAAAPNETSGETRPSSEHLDADLAGAWLRDGRLFRQFQDLGAAGDPDVSPCHARSIEAHSLGVTVIVDGLTGDRR
jgi:hypothetical protein